MRRAGSIEYRFEDNKSWSGGLSQEDQHYRQARNSSLGQGSDPYGGWIDQLNSSDMTGLFLPISAVFPGVGTDVRTLKAILSQLSRTDTLFWCARLNLAITGDPEKDHVEGQQFCIDQFFAPSEIEAINVFASKHGGLERVTVFFRGQLLELLRWVSLLCVDHPEDGATYEDPEIRRKFAQAALVVSDIWATRVFQNKFSFEGGIELARMRALGPIRKSLEATARVPDLTQTLGRGWVLFKHYLPKYYRSFDSEFASATGLSLVEYFNCFTAIATSFMNPKTNSGIFNLGSLRERAGYSHIFSTYVELESQDPNELRRALWHDIEHEVDQYGDAPADYYRALREKPILRTQDGRAIILDAVFYGEKAAIGPLFHILKTAPITNEVFRAFGQAFEDYCLDMLGRMFPTSGTLVSRFCRNIDMIDADGEAFEVDGILNDVQEVVVFEIKSVFIREDVVSSEDFQPLLQLLQSKYSFVNESGDRARPKGVGQLARAVLSIARQRSASDPTVRDVRLVYPVLIVHDGLLTSPVYGNFFASEFAAHLTPDAVDRKGMMEKGGVKVAPVIIMSVDDIENLEVSVEHFAFRDLLRDYSDTCPDRLVSLHNFVASSSLYAMYHNRGLAEIALQAIDACRAAVFGNESENENSADL